MTNYRTLHTGTWEIRLPDDWIQGKSTDGSLYFEAGDGTKGIYVTTWQLGEQDRREPQEIAEAFRSSDLGALARMQGYQWQCAAESIEPAAGVHVLVTDMLAADKNYRSVGKIIVAPPLLVRASFHDYACTGYDASRGYFAPIIDSLRLRQEPFGDVPTTS